MFDMIYSLACELWYSTLRPIVCPNYAVAYRALDDDPVFRIEAPATPRRSGTG